MSRLFLGIFLLLVAGVTAERSHAEDDLEFFAPEHSFFQADEALMTTGGHQKCVPIPQNMTLCHGIGYDEMLIPNLLDHETVREAMEESVNWLPLANIKCHEHTRLFLCSLLAPLCPMQQPPPSQQMDTLSAPANSFPPPSDIILSSAPVNIYPCRSLCESVKMSCQGVMQKHGFPWPEILSCSRFPLDNDMCITPYNHVESTEATRTPTTTTTTMRTTAAVAHRGRKPTTTKSPSRWHSRTRMSTTTRPTTTTTMFTTPLTTKENARTTTTAISITPDVPLDSCDLCNAVTQTSHLDELYCQSEFVGKIRFRRQTRRGTFLAKRPKTLRFMSSSNTTEQALMTAKSMELDFDAERSTPMCRKSCRDQVDLKTQLYLVFGKISQRETGAWMRKSAGPRIEMRLVIPWFGGPNNRDFRQAEKRLLNLKCGTKSGKKDPKNTKGF